MYGKEYSTVQSYKAHYKGYCVRVDEDEHPEEQEDDTLDASQMEMDNNWLFEVRNYYYALFLHKTVFLDDSCGLFPWYGYSDDSHVLFQPFTIWEHFGLENGYDYLNLCHLLHHILVYYSTTLLLATKLSHLLCIIIVYYSNWIVFGNF